jgi:pimeloyl-ACP methyl ester carboxylesterase
MASDVLAVMDILAIKRASIVGFSDGGNIGIDIAINNPDRLVKLFALGAVFNPSGIEPTVSTDALFGLYVERAAADFIRLSKTPTQFDAFVAQISEMWARLPNFTADQLRSIKAPVAIAAGEYEEAVKIEHTEELAALIPGSTLILLPNLSHFAMWQNPEAFNTAVLKYLEMK